MPKFCKFCYALKLEHQAYLISEFSPEITEFSLLYRIFITLPALRLSHENLRQNHKISDIFFFTSFYVEIYM